MSHEPIVNLKLILRYDKKSESDYPDDLGEWLRQHKPKIEVQRGCKAFLNDLIVTCELTNGSCCALVGVLSTSNSHPEEKYQSTASSETGTGMETCNV